MSGTPFRRFGLDMTQVSPLAKLLRAHLSNKSANGTILRSVETNVAVDHGRSPETRLKLVFSRLVRIVETVERKPDPQFAAPVAAPVTRPNGQGSAYPWQSRVPRKMS